MKIYIFLLEKLVFWWDVLFTVIDQQQLKLWVKMSDHLTDLKYSPKIGQDKIDLKDWEDL
jgi:hypothetical protein